MDDDKGQTAIVVAMAVLTLAGMGLLAFALFFAIDGLLGPR